MNILERVINQKKNNLERNKDAIPVSELEKSEYFNRETFSLAEKFRGIFYPGIIAEFKRKSPSKGIINDRVPVEEVTKGYTDAGAVALSVLTDMEFFQGSVQDIMTIRPVTPAPILQKDFIIDEYQILEAKSIGADVILLIAAALDVKQTKKLAELAKSFNLDVLLEIHDKNELNHINEHVDLVGVNNRDLETFKVDINTSMVLVEMIPDEFIKISESGIEKPMDILLLHEAGFKGYLIGESFMKHEHPSAACKEFINKIMKSFPEANAI